MCKEDQKNGCQEPKVCPVQDEKDEKDKQEPIHSEDNLISNL